jgi:hypothetical protein
MTLKRTPVTRTSGAELVRRIAEETAELPPTRREPEPVALPPSPPPMPAPLPITATEQINFRGSPALARLLARLAAEQGSIRLVVARLLEGAGHEVPSVDLAPPPGRRRL